MNFVEIAVDDCGIYPQSTQKIDHALYEETGKIEFIESTPRTEWQEGWNAAVMTIHERASALELWYNALTDRQKNAIKTFEAHGLMISLKKKKDENEYKIKTWFIMNDTFYYACADGCDVSVEELERLYDVVVTQVNETSISVLDKNTVAWIPVAFASIKRDEEILKPLQSDTYFKAKELLKTRGFVATTQE